MVNTEVKFIRAEFPTKMARVGGRLGELKDTWPKVADELDRIVETIFESEGAAGARGAWKPLSPDYEKRKHPDRGILRKTDSLFTSLTRKYSANAIFLARKEGFTRGTRLKYAGFHQSGTKNMPARPITLRDNHKRRLRDVLRQQLKAKIVSLGVEVK